MQAMKSSNTSNPTFRLPQISPEGLGLLLCSVVMKVLNKEVQVLCVLRGPLFLLRFASCVFVSDEAVGSCTA